MGLFDWMGSDPSKAAGKYLKKIPGTVKPYYEPYIEAGKRQLPGLEEEYGHLISDPSSVLSDIGAGYHESPGYKFALQQGLQGAQHSAAAGGMAGSPMAQQQSMQLASDIASQDFDKYMHNALGLYGTGLSGSEDLYKSGMNSSDTLAKILGDTMGSKASNAAAGANWRNKMNLGLTGLGLTGAFDYFHPSSGGGSGGESDSMEMMSKYLPYAMMFMGQ